MRPTEAAQTLAISRRTLSDWANAGLLPYRETPGGHRRYPRDAVVALAETLDHRHESLRPSIGVGAARDAFARRRRAVLGRGSTNGQEAPMEQMVKAVDQALERTAALVAQTNPSNFSNPTPCSGFTVKDVLNHLIGGNAMYVDVVSGKESAFDGATDRAGDDPSGAFLASKTAVLEALSDPKVFERNWKFPFGELPPAQGLGILLLEATVHGWDLAKGLGVDATIDPTLATTILEGAKQAITPEWRNPEGNPFGPAVEVPDSASPTEKLVAFLGRTP
jgi:uncharacterized protein (TIGR03086 family)